MAGLSGRHPAVFWTRRREPAADSKGKSVSPSNPTERRRAGRPRPRRDDLARYAGETVDDLAGPNPRLVFVGINPGLWTAATNTPFAHPGNRFYPALTQAHLIEPPLDPAAGLLPAERRHFLERGLAVTNFVNRATARASELTDDEIRRGGVEVLEKLRRWRPAAVAILGVTAYRVGFERPRAQRGEQPERLAGARTFVFGNPSGLNAHETIGTLAAAFAQAATAAGIAPLV